MSGFMSNTVQVGVARKSGEHFEYLILRRCEDSYMYPQMRQCVTGRNNPEESAVEAALRELKEETNLVPARFWTIPYVSVFYDSIKDAVNASTVFGALVEPNAEVKISNEHMDFRWAKLEECLKILPLPSHREGLKIFEEYILTAEDDALFEINLETLKPYSYKK